MAAAVFGLGGATPPAGTSTTTTATNTWTRIPVTYTPGVGDRTALRVQLYMNTAHVNVDVDSTSLYETHLVNPSGEAGTTQGWSVFGTENLATYCDLPSRAFDGRCFIETNAPSLALGESVFQDVVMTPQANHDYTFELWARTPVPGQVATVVAAVFGLGGATSPTGASTTATLDNTWRRVAITYTPTVGDRRALRVQLYMATPNVNVDLDSMNLRANLLVSSSFENGAAAGWGVLGHENFAVYTDAARAFDGTSFAETNAIDLTSGGSIFQDATQPLVVGRPYTFELWARTPVTGQTASVALALWGLGGATAPTNTTTAITVGNTWSRIRATYTATADDRSALRAQLYLGTQGVNVDLDATSLR